jgi:endonuclease YncB( thermonuclease family)
MHRGEYLKRQAEWTWKEAQKEMQAEQEFTSCGDGAVIRLKNTTPHRLLLVDSAQKIKQPWRIRIHGCRAPEMEDSAMDSGVCLLPMRLSPTACFVFVLKSPAAAPVE